MFWMLNVSSNGLHRSDIQWGQKIKFSGGEGSGSGVNQKRDYFSYWFPCQTAKLNVIF